ncbi:restriction endonuclease subunit S [Aliarcobacter skirrowii]|uniref:restriction endonuclease subunit S n=1 Tax=Aliarcobacter skirrowii TaxID=28200 RepID=UPI0029ACC259|nr:restriction endonuclease subunit S [Aliarcobacter skirrowii]MDX4050781.1 restriction endonuclease subunit S [Aliarcobacter skirrowii]
MNQIKQGYKQTKVGIIPEDWEVVKLGKVTKINPNNKNLPENFIYIDLESVVKGKLLKQNFISKYEAPSRAQRVLKKNDILFQMVRPYQMNNLFFEFDGNYVASTGYAQIRTNQSDKYIFQYIHLKRFVDKVLEKCTGSNYPAINSSDLSDILIILPPLKEQEKIAEILTTWDEAITKQIELLEAKELQKKALMQKLLSGEVRFSGFSDEWEEVRLGEIGEFKTSSIDKIINENERLVNLINYMDVYRNKHIDKNFRCSKTSLKEEQYEKVNLKKGDILFTPSSETPDDIGHSAVIIEDLPNTVYSYHLVRFRPQKSIDLKFSGYVFNNIDILKEFAKRANGSTRFTLSIKDFNETKAKLPSLPEQQKIAEVLSLADDEINLLKNELEELKLQKKALMQKLLTGQVRVKV